MRREFAVVVVAVIAANAGSSAQDAKTPSAGAAPAQGLAFFNLAESGQGRVSFASSAERGGAQVLSDVVITGEDGQEVRAETLRMAGVRDTADGTVFDELEILGLTGGDDADGLFTLERFSIVDPSPRLAAMIAAAFSAEGAGDDVDWGDPSDYSFSSFELEGFSAGLPSGGSASFEAPAADPKKGAPTVTAEEPSAGGGQVSFDGFRLTGLGDSKLAGFAFDGFEMSAPMEDGSGGEMSFALRSWTMNGLDMSGLDEFAEADFEDEAAVNQALTESGLTNPFIKRYDDYALEGLYADVDGVLVELDRLGGTADTTRNGIATDDAIEGLVVSFDDSKGLGAQGLAGLQMLGYDRVAIDSRCVQTADEEADRIYTDQCAFNAEDAFSLSTSYDITGIGAYMRAAAEQGFSADAFDPTAMTELLAPLMIAGFELKLTDDSFVERALSAAAEKQGQTPDQLRQQAVAMMAIGTLMAPPGAVQTLVGEAISAATDFLEEPGTLRISLRPEEPVSLAELTTAFESQDFDKALGLLNIEVVAEE